LRTNPNIGLVYVATATWSDVGTGWGWRPTGGSCSVSW